ncbi:MAG: 3-isopropylmalate dehydrogenase [Sphaerochaetaceae bacterium]|nr:3-isopropylmalate dehydrogenase [Sphaerochaetaceae bacterium]
MKLKIAVVPGDGIGPDIITEALKVLGEVGMRFGHRFDFSFYLAGGAALDAVGEPLPESTVLGCRDADAILLGAVGGPAWDHLEGRLRPEQALLGLRSQMGLFCNLRPAVLHTELSSACPLKPEIIGDGLDIMVVRELTGGIYFGERGITDDGESAFDTMTYSVDEVKRIAKIAFEAAMKRGKKLCSVDKANILENSRLWRRTVVEVSQEYPEVELTHMYVDNAAMQLVRDPGQFDVIVTTNMFGDILSDEASMITGSIGMLPSASLNADNFGMYEPIHGSAPDIAGKDMANPIATVLSCAMMLRYTFDLNSEAEAMEKAVTEVLAAGYRTKDIHTEGTKLVGTRKMGDLIAEAVKSQK